MLVVLYILTTVYLYKTYKKSDKLSEKLTEIIIMETLGFAFLGLILLNPNKKHDLVSTIGILQWTSFFCMFFFLFYFDYGNQESEGATELNTKKEIFLHFVKKSGNSNLIVTKNKKFLFSLAVYVALEIVKALI